jgi:hypothetical protein
MAEGVGKFLSQLVLATMLLLQFIGKMQLMRFVKSRTI